MPLNAAVLGDDSPTPLCDLSTMRTGAFADLVHSFSDADLTTMLYEATRACETETNRRLAPFTTAETHRAEGIDPDELGALSSGIPLDLNASLGASYATALGGGTNLVRKVWLAQTPPHFPELWAYSNVSISITLSIGGVQATTPLAGPFPDTGMCWFQLGTFCPPGSMIAVTYSGGYQTIPADLRRACRFMCASLAAREIDPMGDAHGHHPDALEALAVSWLNAYQRTG